MLVPKIRSPGTHPLASWLGMYATPLSFQLSFHVHRDNDYVPWAVKATQTKMLNVYR